jgi:hypothetical protein
LATILLIPLVSVQARGNDATARKVMQELYELSGLESQIDSIADLVSQGLAQQPGRIPPQTRAAVERALRRAYDAGELEKAVLADLEGRHDARHAAGALAWLRSPLGRRIAHIEAESATTAGAHALEEFARALQENPPRPERLALEQRFDAALQNTASMVELTIATSIGIAIALDATHPVDRRSDPEQMRSDVENQRAELHSMLRPNSVVAFLYIYRELSDEEIDAYIAFGETDAGRWYTDSMMGAFVAAITSASRSITGDAVVLPHLVVGNPVQSRPERRRLLGLAGLLPAAVGAEDGDVDRISVEELKAELAAPPHPGRRHPDLLFDLADGTREGGFPRIDPTAWTVYLAGAEASFLSDEKDLGVPDHEDQRRAIDGSPATPVARHRRRRSRSSSLTRHRDPPPAPLCHERCGTSTVSRGGNGAAAW